jgi:hypothetical protein
MKSIMDEMFNKHWIIRSCLIANLCALTANYSDPRLLVIAEKSQTFWHDHNWITLDLISLCPSSSYSVEVVRPIPISDSWSAIGGDFDGREDIFMVDVDEGDNGEPTSQTNPSNVESADFGLKSDFP